jgi:hypothetical protein
METDLRVILHPVFLPTEFEQRGGIVVEHAHREPWAAPEPKSDGVRHRYYPGEIPPAGPDELGYSFSVEPDELENGDPLGKPIVHRGLTTEQAALLAARLNEVVKRCHAEWGWT